MADTFLLDLVTPERSLFSGPVVELVAPGAMGEFGVLPGHAHLLSELKAGRLRYRTEGGERTLAAAGGFAEVTAEKVTVLLDDAAYADELDRETLQREIERLEDEVPDPSDERFPIWEKTLTWKKTCLEVAKGA